MVDKRRKAKQKKDDSKTVILKYSIPIPKEGGGTINANELKFERLKMKHLRLLPKDFTEKDGQLELSAMIPLIAAIANSRLNLPMKLIWKIWE